MPETPGSQTTLQSLKPYPRPGTGRRRPGSTSRRPGSSSPPASSGRNFRYRLPRRRNIEWEKVKEIYRLGLKHGMRLATISGVNGVYSDDDIAEIRRRALIAREN